MLTAVALLTSTHHLVVLRSPPPLVPWTQILTDYRNGMVFYPTTGGPSAGQAGLPHYEVAVAKPARSAGTQELEGEDTEGAVSSPGLGQAGIECLVVSSV
jgi:hypothetical protein